MKPCFRGHTTGRNRWGCIGCRREAQRTRLRKNAASRETLGRWLNWLRDALDLDPIPHVGKQRRTTP
jgi:hypothetical protein